MQEGRATRIVIRMKKNPTPTQNATVLLSWVHRRRCLLLLLLVVTVSPSLSLSSCPLFLPIIPGPTLAFLLPHEKLLATAVGGLVVVLVVLVLVVVIPDSIGLFGMDNNNEYPPDMWGKGSDVAEAVRNQQG